VNTLKKRITEKTIIRIFVPNPALPLSLALVSKHNLLWVQPYALLYTFGTINDNIAFETVQFKTNITLYISNQYTSINTSSSDSWKLMISSFQNRYEYAKYVVDNIVTELRDTVINNGYHVCFEKIAVQQIYNDAFYCRTIDKISSDDVADDPVNTEVKMNPFILGSMIMFNLTKFAFAAYMFYYVNLKMNHLHALSEELIHNDLIVSNSTYEPPLWQNIFPSIIPLKFRVNFHIWEGWRLVFLHIILYTLATITCLTRLYWPVDTKDSGIITVTYISFKIPLLFLICSLNAGCTIIKLFFSKVPSHIQAQQGFSLVNNAGFAMKMLFGLFTSCLITAALVVSNYYVFQPFFIPMFSVDLFMFLVTLIVLTVTFWSSHTQGLNIQGWILLNSLSCGVINTKERLENYDIESSSALRAIYFMFGWILDVVWIFTLFILGMNTGVIIFRLAMCTMANLVIDTNTVAMYSYFITVGTTLWSFISDIERPFDYVKEFLLDRRLIFTREQIELYNNSVSNYSDTEVDDAYLQKMKGKYRIVHYRVLMTWSEYLTLSDMARVEMMAQAKITQFVVTLVILCIFYLGISTFDPNFIGGENKQLFTIISSSILPLVPTLMKYLAGRNSDMGNKALQSRLAKSLERLEGRKKVEFFPQSSDKPLPKDIGFEFCLLDATADRKKALQSLRRAKRVIKKVTTKKRKRVNETTHGDGDYELFSDLLLQECDSDQGEQQHV
jgi:hypothetical protein